MAERIHFAVYDGAAERIAAWLKGPDEYAAVLRRQFNADGTARQVDADDQIEP